MPSHSSQPSNISTKPYWCVVYLLSIPRRHSRLHLPQTLTQKQYTINQHAVCGTLDLKVAKEHICAEEGEDLVDAIVRFAIWVDVEIGL